MERFEIKDVHERQRILTQGGAYNVNTPFQTRRDQFETLNPHKPINNTLIHNILSNDAQGMVVGAPFTLNTYQENANADLVYSGIMKDPVSGREYHTFENAMPEKESDQSLNRSFHAMERLTEQARGSTNDDIKYKLDIQDYKPEDNIQEKAITGDMAFKKVMGISDYDAVRLWDLERAKQESRRKMENNFEGIDERVGGPTGYIGLHPMHYARKEHNQVQVSAYELDDRERMTNASAIVTQHGAWAAPTLYQRKEQNKSWNQVGQWGGAHGLRDTLTMPGDKEAEQMKPSFIQNKHDVQIVLM